MVSILCGAHQVQYNKNKPNYSCVQHVTSIHCYCFSNQINDTKCIIIAQFYLKKSVSTRAHYGGGFSAPTLTELQAHLKHHLTKRAEILSLFILTPTIFRFKSGSEVGRRRGLVFRTRELHINVYDKA